MKNILYEVVYSDEDMSIKIIQSNCDMMFARVVVGNNAGWQ